MAEKAAPEPITVAVIFEAALALGFSMGLTFWALTENTEQASALFGAITGKVITWLH